MTLALAGVCALGWAEGAPWAGLLAALALGGSAAGLHLALDPYLFYWPPALALLAWAVVAARSRTTLAIVLCALAGAFNPMLLAGSLVIAWLAWVRGARRHAALAMVVPVLTFAALAPFAESWGMSIGRLHGTFLPHHGWRVLDASVAAFASPGFAASGPPPALAHQLARVSTLVALALVGVHALARRGSRASIGAWIAAAIAFVFVGWWNPEQLLFYLGPAWLVAMALLLGRPGLRAPPVAWLWIVPLVAYNVAVQAWPASRGGDPGRAFAAAVRDRIAPADLLVFAIEPRLSVEYRTGVPTRALSAIVADRPRGASTLEVLRSMIAERGAAGGTVWIEVGRDGRPFLAPWLAERVDVDLEPRDLDRWLGETRVLAGLSFRSLVDERGPGHRARTATSAAAPIPLAEFGWASARSGYGPIEIDRSNGEPELGDGRPLSIGGRGFARGVGAHAPSSIRVYTGGACSRVRAWVGVDDEVDERGSVRFAVRADDRRVWQSAILTGRDPPARLDVSIEGAAWIELSTDPADDNNWDDYSDWAEIELVCESLP